MSRIAMNMPKTMAMKAITRRAVTSCGTSAIEGAPALVRQGLRALEEIVMTPP